MWSEGELAKGQERLAWAIGPYKGNYHACRGG